MKHGDTHRNPLMDEMSVNDNMVTGAVLDANRPPQPYPDDPERLRDCHVFTDDPKLQALLELGSDESERPWRTRARSVLSPAL